ncbi:GntR family transcriptional regulator [Nonomuraea phyllanthi]|uniref:GntR family transcriptional regulator n=1 Tax=Nonomuraea phyllanthi TaxID=2219224 RepID=A0A5C4WSY4_9ACTN|nr:GntR family transcriptional regulator [Nonomuraea phyllanthi]KAB8196315.1 GntR family transcriptional regulator [Nonomuraea phyllanthi]
MSSPDPAPQAIQRNEPLREAVYARIVDSILSGHYPPGSSITEAALSRVLQVSRTPIREALLRLESEGVLSSALARGFTVRALDRREVTELYPILGALEGLALRTAHAPDAAAMDTLHRTLDELAGCDDAVRRWRLDTVWHGVLVAASRNQHLVSLTTQLRVNLSRYELTFMREVRSRDAVNQQHREILAAVVARDFTHAAEMVEEHWRESMELVLTWLTQE